MDSTYTPCVEPALDEARRLVDTIGTRGVVSDQALRQSEQVRDCLLTLRYRDESVDPFKITLGYRQSGLSGLGILAAICGVGQFLLE